MKIFKSFLFSVLCTFQAGAQLKENPKGSTNVDLGYLEYLPEGYYSDNTTTYPMLIAFHGIGEGGNGIDLSNLYKTGIFKLIKENNWPSDRKFIVIAPQHESLSSCFFADEIRNFIKQVAGQYKTDLRRIYATGYSCGAIGLWNFISLNPKNDMIAAAVLISGDGKAAANSKGCDIKIPVWALHGQDDNTVAVSGSVDAINKLNTCPEPHPEAKLTVYPGVSHNAWDMTYNLSAGNEIYTWLMYFRSTGLMLSVPEDKNKPEDQTIRLFPNPSGRNVLISLPVYSSADAFITISDIYGRELESFKTNTSEISIDISGYEKGTYVVGISQNNKLTYKRIIKE